MGRRETARTDPEPRKPAYRFERGGIWWAKLLPSDPSYGYGDARGYMPEHILVAERLLNRRIQGHERVRWFSANHRDNRPCNLFIETPTGWLALPKAIRV